MIEFSGNIAYGRKLLCSGVNLRLEGGECVLLCGANGSGKSTLMNRLAKKYPDDIMMIPTGIPKVKGFTLRMFILTGCYNLRTRIGRGRMTVNGIIDDAMEKLGISSLADRYIHTLSDGEFQKACIAIGLCSSRKVLMLDEPTTFLDPENRIAVLSCLRRLADGGRSIVFSSHDIADSLRFCNNVWAIGRDRIFHSAAGESDSLKAAASTIYSENTYL